MEGQMSEIETKAVSAKQGWLRRAAMGAAFAVVGLVSLGAATTPAEAYWNHYGYYHPYYHYYHPYYGYGAYYGPVYYGWGWGWHGGWGYHRHW
jgi:hypothetical protein